MDNTFDVDKFIARIGTRLVEQFEDARAATSPAAVGDAMEQPVKDQLEQLLPRGIGVGSGFVIDSNGATSRQTDVVLYEKDILPDILHQQYARHYVLPMRGRYCSRAGEEPSHQILAKGRIREDCISKATPALPSACFHASSYDRSPGRLGAKLR